MTTPSPYVDPSPFRRPRQPAPSPPQPGPDRLGPDQLGPDQPSPHQPGPPPAGSPTPVTPWSPEPALHGHHPARHPEAAGPGGPTAYGPAATGARPAVDGGPAAVIEPSPDDEPPGMRHRAGRPPRGASATGTLLLLFAVGGAVAVTLGVVGRLHEPTGIAVNVAGFSSPLAAKAWLTTGAASLGLVQLVSALAMYGRLPLAPGAAAWGPVHRWSGRAAFLLTIPVAVHCLYALGFQYTDGRVLAHSLLGCAFYGAITVKLLGLSRDDLPGWFLPLLGGGVLSLLVGLWLTSSLWFFTTVGLSF